KSDAGQDVATPDIQDWTGRDTSSRSRARALRRDTCAGRSYTLVASPGDQGSDPQMCLGIPLTAYALRYIFGSWPGRWSSPTSLRMVERPQRPGTGCGGSGRAAAGGTGPDAPPSLQFRYPGLPARPHARVAGAASGQTVSGALRV